MILQHENARPHVAKPVKTYLETLNWEVLPHPPHSPDIAPSDYYLFWSMAHGLADQQFRSSEDIEKWLDSLMASKDEHFYCNGIRALPERWAIVVANDGQYLYCSNNIVPKFHSLPKIYKPNCPLRPITPLIGFPIYNLSKLLSKSLQKSVGHTEDHIKDSFEFKENFQYLYF